MGIKLKQVWVKAGTHKKLKLGACRKDKKMIDYLDELAGDIDTGDFEFVRKKFKIKI